MFHLRAPRRMPLLPGGKWDAGEAESEIPKILLSSGTGPRFPNPPASVVCLELQIFVCSNLLKL